MAEPRFDEQWKHEGRCRDCRRTNYCKTQCRANKLAIQAKAHAVIMEKTGMGKALEAINEMKGMMGT